METIHDRIRNYREKMSRNFRNAIGDEQGGVANSQPLDLNDNTLSVEINPIVSTIIGKARIFGTNISPDETYNTANNMTVVIPESSHQYVKSSIQGSPFRITGIIYTVNQVLQLAKPFVFTKATISGAGYTKVWQPSKYTDPKNLNAFMIKTSAFQNVIDADTRIDIDFLVGANGTLILTITDKLDMAQALSNKTPIQSAVR